MKCIAMLFLTLYSMLNSIINNNKDYGFGESILHQGQLVFHTPPYSLHAVYLHDSADFTGKVNAFKYAVNSLLELVIS